MKITIDTKEDSQEEIQKAIRLLSSLAGDKEIMSNQGDVFSGGPDDNSSSGNQGNQGGNSGNTGDIFSMFNPGVQNAEPDNASETKEEKKEDETDIEIDIPEVQEYR